MSKIKLDLTRIEAEKTLKEISLLLEMNLGGETRKALNRVYYKLLTLLEAKK